MNKKLITLVALAATLVTSPALAHHHHHHGAAAFGIGAAVGAAVGLVGGALAAPSYSTTVVTTPAVVPAAPAVYAPAPVYQATPVVTYPATPVMVGGYYTPTPVIQPVVVGPTHPIRCNPYVGGWQWRGGNCHEYRPHYNPGHWRVSSHGNPYYNPPVHRGGQWRR